MNRSLCEAVLRGQARRVRGLARGRPLAFALVAATWLLSPVVVWRAAVGLSDTLGPALADPRSTRALSLGLILSCAALGATLGAALPGPAALGRQVGAAPVTRRALALAAVLPAAIGASALTGPILVALLVALAAGAPGGGPAGLLLAALVWAVAVAGATLEESVVRLARGGALRSCLAAIAWSVAVVACALEAVARALDGRAGAVVVGLGAVVAGACASRRYLDLLAARAPAARRRSRRPLLSPRHDPRAAVLASACAVLSRGRELRLTLAAAAVFGVAGVAAGAATGAPAAAGALLGGGSCAVASCFVPLSVRGRIDPARWVWRLTRRTLVAAAWASASLALVLAALVPVQALALAGRGEGLEAVPQIAAFAVLAWAAALAAGAVAPRRPGGAGDDAFSLGAFTVAAVSFGTVVSVLGGGLEDAGAPGAVAAAVVLAAASAASVVALAVSLGRP